MIKLKVKHESIDYPEGEYMGTIADAPDEIKDELMFLAEDKLRSEADDYE